MQIDIQARDFTLTEALGAYVERRIQFGLGSRHDRIGRVSVRLSDINGPRGGADKRCHIRVAFAGMPDVVVDDTEIDLYVAIDHATDRARRAVDRRLSRLMHRPRRMWKKQDAPNRADTDQSL